MIASRTHRRDGREGFTLVELLIVVLIVGLLATIAVPVFNGQRSKAKDSAAVSALRSAVLASRTYYIGASESFGGFDAAALKSNEASLYRTADEPFGAADSPGASADPTRIAIADGVSAGGFSATLNAATDTAGDNPTANSQSVLLCTVSRGDGIFCGKVNLASGGSVTWRYFSARVLGASLALNDSNGTGAGATPINGSMVTGSTF